MLYSIELEINNKKDLNEALNKLINYENLIIR